MGNMRWVIGFTSVDVLMSKGKYSPKNNGVYLEPKSGKGGHINFTLLDSVSEDPTIASLVNEYLKALANKNPPYDALFESYRLIKAENERLTKEVEILQKCDGADVVPGLQKQILDLQALIESKEKEISELKDGHNKMSINYDQAMSDVKDREAKINELNAIIANGALEASRSESKIKTLEASNNSLMQKYNELSVQASEAFIEAQKAKERESDLMIDVKRLTKDNERFTNLKIDGICDMFLECICGVYNKVLDSNDLEEIRTYADHYIERLFDNAPNCGLKLHRYERGDKLSDDSVAPRYVTTLDKEKDRTIKSINKFGCVISGFPGLEVKEDVRVWKYKEPAPKPEEPKQVEPVVDSSLPAASETLAPPAPESTKVEESKPVEPVVDGSASASSIPDTASPSEDNAPLVSEPNKSEESKQEGSDGSSLVVDQKLAPSPEVESAVESSIPAQDSEKVEESKQESKDSSQDKPQ